MTRVPLRSDPRPRTLFLDSGYADLIRPRSGHSIVWSETFHALRRAEADGWRLKLVTRGIPARSRHLEAQFNLPGRATRPKLFGGLQRWDWWVPFLVAARAGVLLQHAHEPPLRTSLPRISVVYDLAFENPLFAPTFSPLLRDELRKWTRLSVARSQRLLAISEFTKKELQYQYDVSERDIAVLPLGVDHEAARSAGHAGHKGLSQLGVEGPYLFHASVLQPRKNIIPMLEAWDIAKHRLPRYQLVLVGRRGWNDQEIVDRIATAHRVLYLGEVERPQLWQLMANADAAVALGSAEGYGLPALEAMAVGKPVVRADSGALPEVLRDRRLLVDPSDPILVAKAMEDAVALAQDAEYVRMLIDHAAAFTWDRTALQIFYQASALWDQHHG